MEVMAQPFAGTLNPTLTVEVRVNGEKITEWEFTDASQQKRVAIIPGDLLKKAKYALKETQPLALIEFSIRNPISPKALGMNQDPRELGLGLSKLTFSQY
jgi:predicted YcjX-like family ATPase